MLPFVLRRLRYRAHRSRLQVPLIWLRHRGLDSSDVFLASYPRSGQHWTRFLLMECLTGMATDFENVERVIPKVGMQLIGPALVPGGGRIIQTHESWRKEYRRAIYLVRDVRDVLLSDFAFEEAQNNIKYYDVPDFDAFVLPWLKGKVQAMGTWQAHVNSWLDSPLEKNGNMIVIKYEQMRANPTAELARMLEFLGVRPGPDVVEKAVVNNTLEKMRAKEDKTAKFQVFHRTSSEDHRFIRKGAVGGWHGKLTPSQIDCIRQYAGDALARLGYEVETPAKQGQTLSTP